MPSPIILYDLCGADPALRFSPHCWKARWALAHKGLAVETVPTPFTAIGDIGGGGFTKTVPVIDDNGRLVRESFAIAEYLDEKVPERPLFGSHGRTLARFVESASQRALTPLIMRMMVKDIHDALAPADQAYFRKSREKRIGRLEDYQEGTDAVAPELVRALTPLRHALAHGDFLGGETPIFADYILAGGLMWLRTITGEVPLAADDPVAAWFGRILDMYDGLAREAPKAT